MKDGLNVFKARDGQAKQFPAKGKAKNNFFKIKPPVCPGKEWLENSGGPFIVAG
jgi:hypothetical protein